MKSIYKLVFAILFVAAACLSTMVFAAENVPASESAELESKDLVRTANGEAPVLVSIIVKPKKLKKNNLNKLRIVVKYEDGDGNLQGGTLELSVSESNGYRRQFSIPLDSSKFGKTKGKGKLKINVVIGNCKWAKFKGWLKDTDENNGNDKQVKLSASGPKGPKWGVKLKQRAKDFQLYDKDGNLVSLHEFYGKVILLDISTMWCGPCKQEAADAEQLYQKYKNQGFIVINVLFEDANGEAISQSDCATWVKTYKMTFPVLADINQIVWWTFAELRYIPLNLVIGRDMVIYLKVTGYPKEQIENKIQELL